jgi:DNA-binding GntR family transcriptional regulator
MKKNKSITLIQEAYQNIKQMIFRKNLGPGQKLVYRDLCEMLNMSRTPIINALYRLEQEGFLVLQPFRGFYIRPVNPQEAWDLYGVREALEVYAIEEAVRKATDEDVETLAEKVLSHQEYMPDYYDQKKFLLDVDFHIQIAQISQNRVLVEQLKKNLEHIQLRCSFANMIPTRMTLAAREHHGILEAFKARDSKRCIEAVQIHLAKAKDHALAFISHRD